jgi:hypothetical protein
MCTVEVERGRDWLVGETLKAAATVVTAHMKQRGTAESVYIVIRRAAAVLLIASWTHLLQEFSRFCVAMAAVLNQRQTIKMLSILLLMKGKTTLDTNQWPILALMELEIVIGRGRRKQKGQRKFVFPVVSRVVLPQLRREEEILRNQTLPLVTPLVLPHVRRQEEFQRNQTLLLLTPLVLPHARTQEEFQRNQTLLLVSPVLLP